MGVTKGGLPQQDLESNPKIKLVLIADYLEGFRLLLAQEIDAVGADRWVGAYTLQKNDIRGITIRGEPLAEKLAGIAVKKGNTALLDEINLGISKLKNAGIIEKIEERWAPKEVLFLTREQIQKTVIYLGLTLLMALLGAAFLWISSLRKQISLRERTAKELDKRTRELDAILSSVQDYLYIFDPEGRFVFANRKLLDLWGLSAEEAIGKTMRDLDYPVAVETALLSSVQGVLRTGQVTSNDTHYTSPTGVDAFYENILAPMRGSDGEIAFVAGSSRDITRHKEAEEALRRSESIYRTIARHFPNGAVYLFDREMRYLVADGAALATTGWSREMIEGRLISDLDEETRSIVEPRYRRVLAGETLRVETPYRGRIHLSDYVPIKDERGEVVMGLVVSMDVTEQRRMEDELRTSRDELELRVQERTAELETTMRKLEESNQALQEFASIASHDMQEPLRKVRAFGVRLNDKCGVSLGDEGKDYLERMLKATERMQSLLTSLLDYSRMAAKAEPFRPVDLGAVVKEVLLDLEVRIEKTGGVVQVGELPTLDADPTQMRQLFQNLIGNALKFHKEGVRPLVQVHCSANGAESYEITVADNGIGFEEELLDKIFAPFQRLHGRSSSYEGTGMGLAICKKIVKRHGGTITARSTPGHGARFIISLPVKQRKGV